MPVGMYLDTDTIPNLDSAITIKNLLRHTAGLNDVWSESVTPGLWNAVWGNRDSLWQYWPVLKYLPLPSGLTTHKYTNSNTYVLSAVIEAVTGKSLETTFQDRIFSPVGMSKSSVSTGKPFNMASVNGVWNDNENRSAWSHTSYMSSRSGNSALVASTMDAAKFYRAYYRDELLSKTTMDSLRAAAAGSRISRGTVGGAQIYTAYGYETSIFEAVMPNNDTLVAYGHGGNGIHNSTSLHWPRENITIALVQNDFRNYTTNTQVALFMDLINEIYRDLPFATTGVESGPDGEAHPSSFALFPAYPNPFNPTTNIGFRLPNAGSVKVAVFDVLGREIAVLMDQELAPETYTATWNATGMASGLYVYRIEAVSVGDPSKSGSASSPSRFVDAKKVVLTR